MKYILICIAGFVFGYLARGLMHQDIADKPSYSEKIITSTPINLPDSISRKIPPTADPMHIKL